VSDRDHVVDIGYRLLMVGGSFCLFCPSTRSPYPSDWIEDQFITVNFDEDLRQDLSELVPPAKRMAATPAGTTRSNPIYDEILAWLRVLKLNGLLVLYSAEQVSIHEQAISSYVFPLAWVCGQCLPCLV